MNCGIVKIMEKQKEDWERWAERQPLERAIIKAYRKAGWQATIRYMPMIFRKVGQKPRLVWVKRKNVNPQLAGLPPAAKICVSIFTAIGGQNPKFDIVIEDVDSISVMGKQT